MPSLNTKLASAPNTTSNYVLKATSSTTIGNSLIFDNGTNVGVGTASPQGKLHISGGYTGFQYNSAGTFPAYNTYFGAIGTNFSNSGSELDIWNTVGGGFAFRRQTAASTQNVLMYISSGGNVGIGTTNPANVLHVVGGNGNQMDVDNTGQRFSQINLKNNGTQRAYLAIDQTNSEFQVFGQSGFALTLGAGGAERARVTSTGNLLVGGITSTSAYLDGFISVSVPSGTAPAACFKNLNADQFVASFWNNASSGDNIFVRFVSDSGASVRGTIFYSRANGVTRFDGQASGTYSDERLKDIKGEMTYGLDTINKIKTYDFNWRRNGNKGFGVKAQEICELIPEIVEKGNDGEIDPMEFQTTDIWKVNYNELVPVLIKSIQELNQKVEAQQQQINQLINK